MNDEQLLRYSRHILLPEIGIEGQEKIRAAHALVIGAGGLGSPVALYLASAGIGACVRAGAPSTLEQFRALLRFGEREGIELRFFFSPYHAWQYETLAAMGLWPTFEYWKQQLARIVTPP